MKRILVFLGVALILASVAVFAYGNLKTSAPLMGSENGQASSVDYVAFFGFGFGGAGFLILLFSLFQYFGKRKSK
jgi:hypothetical protein